MNNCLFCKIIAGEIPSKKIYEDEHLYAFRDINPQAPQHILIIPKKHIARIEDLHISDSNLMGEIVYTAKIIADDLGLVDGYRLVFNNGPFGGQEVEHIHCHLMGGRQFNWPAG